MSVGCVMSVQALSEHAAENGIDMFGVIANIKQGFQFSVRHQGRHILVGS